MADTNKNWRILRQSYMSHVNYYPQKKTYFLIPWFSYWDYQEGYGTISFSTEIEARDYIELQLAGVTKEVIYL